MAGKEQEGSASLQPHRLLFRQSDEMGHEGQACILGPGRGVKPACDPAFGQRARHIV